MKEWDLVIEPNRKILDLKMRELIRYRDLVFLFVKRDFITQYKQTILGPLWFLINPLISTIMFTFIFGRMAKIGTDGIPYLLFYYSGTMLWNFFTTSFNDSSNIFINNSNLFGKVYFPRLTVPVSNVISNFIKIAIQFVLLMIFFLYYLITGTITLPEPMALLFPLIFVWLALLATGMGMIISSVTTKYRDLKHLVTFGLSLAMYATPVVYPLSEIPEKYKWISLINPVSAPIEIFRIWFYHAGAISISFLLSSIIQTLVLFLLGLILFNQNERNYIDVI